MAKKVKKKKKAKKANPRSIGKDGRNSKGQFQKGNTLSKGNSGGGNKEDAKKLKRTLIEAVSEKDIKLIVKKMVFQAKNGDAAARKELFDRLWGRAKQEIEGTLNIRDADEKPLTEEELIERLNTVKEAGTGMDVKSIEGNGNSH